MLFLKQPLILSFLCHESATTCQIDSNKASNSKFKPYLCSCVKIELIESTAPPQKQQKRAQLFLDTRWKSERFSKMHNADDGVSNAILFLSCNL